MSLELSPSTYRRITGVALVALVAIVVTGGAVRLTGSGLGCPDWPTCEGSSLVPPMRFHAWVEYANRIFTGFVSLAVAAAVLGSLVLRPRRRDLVRLSLGLAAGIAGQILLGAVVVLTHLTPLAVTGHFLLSMVLVWNASVLHEKASQELQPPQHPRLGAVEATPADMERRTKRWDHARDLATAVLLWTPVVLVTGTLVTSAGPHSGDPGNVERLDIPLRVVARIHGTSVLVYLAMIVGLALLVHRLPASYSSTRRARVLAWVAAGQAGVGWAQYFLGVPALLVGLHLLGATLVWLSTVRLYSSVKQDHRRYADETSVEETIADRQFGCDLRSAAAELNT